MYQCNRFFVILSDDLGPLATVAKAYSCESSWFLVTRGKCVVHEYLLLTQQIFFHICFLVVFPRDHTTDFAFVIEHLLPNVLRTFFSLLRSHAICQYLLGLHISLVDRHCKICILEHIYHKLKVSLKIVLPP